MSQFRALIVVTIAALLGTVAVAQQPSPTKAVAPKAPATPRAAAPPAASKPIATIKDVMNVMIDPGSKVVFSAVSTEATASGTVEHAPANDREWAVVRNNALLMAEGANLLLMPGRRVANDSAPTDSGSLPPAEIEARILKDRATWNTLAAQFRDRAVVALNAATAKKAKALEEAGADIDEGCENCHLKFWYPVEKGK